MLLRWTVRFVALRIPLCPYKRGRQPILISPRNSTSAIVHLLKAGNAQLLILGPGFEARLDEEVGSVPSVTISLHSLPSSYNLSVETPFSLLEERADIKSALDGEEDTIAFYLHTSGSTGHPKLVPWKHRNVIATLLFMQSYRKDSKGETLYTSIPLSHAAGLWLSWWYTLGLRGRFVFLESHLPPTAATVLKDLQDPIIECGESAFTPNILEDICDGPLRQAGAEVLKRFRLVMVTGAPLRPDVGFFLSRSGVRLISGLGMSEAAPLSTFCLHPLQSPDDWQYLCWVDVYGIEMIPVDEEEVSLRELVIFPHLVAPAVLNQADPDRLATNDLFQRHPDPDKHMLWKHAGRKDDLIVLNNGLKANARQLDSLLCASPLIARVALFGRGRFQVGVLIVPSLGEDTTSQAYRDAVWYHVAMSVNPVVPQYARLVRPLLLFASPDRPFLFTDKGTLRTNATLGLYQDDINAAYLSFQSGDADASILSSSGFFAGNHRVIVRFLTDIVSAALGRHIDENVDVFLAGGDSMMAMRVTSALGAALRQSSISHHLPQNIVYQHPTIGGLASAVLAILESALSNADEPADKTHSGAAVRTSLAKYRQSTLERMRAMSAERIDRSVGDDSDDDAAVFVVTGTTGSLGVILVSRLLHDSTVRKIYLLHRKRSGSSARDLHERAFAAKGADFGPLVAALAAGRAVFVQVDIAQPSLGIENEVYAQIASEATHIVHSAWAVNFNLSLESFEPHLVGVQRIIELALSSPKCALPRIIFISSVAVMGGGPDVATRPVPEQALESAETCGSMGYAQSKFVSEKLLEAACEHEPRLYVAIVRAGQLAGSLNGRWARSEHIPIIMRASVQLGKVPDKVVDTRWLPLDIAAEALVKLAMHSNFSPRRGYAAFYHLEATRATTWSHIAAAICRYPSSTGHPDQLPLVSGEDWLSAVTSGPDNVARRLLPFFEAMMAHDLKLPALDTSKMREIVGDMLDFEVDEVLLERYVACACE
ncbi:acetyl-CoA synthetase-like protein [Vararia minispora EC-137]|uniref:Acetyl-CoA synthetase-like protein n=1 Tax=Vararia minispora EC-137 TaxID=1314806 RepID=A0ACB8QNR9_9AGAM|nr:acetyl-CoA synthetase-like protein [Vararia minispora EC-137]